MNYELCVCEARNSCRSSDEHHKLRSEERGESEKERDECFNSNNLSLITLKDLGGYSVGVPPLPIPNRAVKPDSADGTA